MPLLRNPDKSKLSKRKNPVWASFYREQGFLPETVVNYLATLAWAHPDGKEMFTMEEMMKVFTLEAVQTTAPIFDVEKLRWLNGEYLRKDPDLAEKIFAFYQKKYPQAQIIKILPLVVERMKTLLEFGSLAGFFFARPTEFERPVDQALLEISKEALASCAWNHDAMEAGIREASQKAGKKARDVFMELRVAVTGKTVGPPLLESLEILGKEEVIARLIG